MIPAPFKNTPGQTPRTKPHQHDCAVGGCEPVPASAKPDAPAASAKPHQPRQRSETHPPCQRSETHQPCRRSETQPVCRQSRHRGSGGRPPGKYKSGADGRSTSSMGGGAPRRGGERGAPHGSGPGGVGRLRLQRAYPESRPGTATDRYSSTSVRKLQHISPGHGQDLAPIVCSGRTFDRVAPHPGIRGCQQQAAPAPRERPASPSRRLMGTRPPIKITN
jgi:hypothetical protein